jgi:hypothetical protein
MPPPHHDISPEWKMLTASRWHHFLEDQDWLGAAGKWALDHRIDIRPLGDAAEFSERERARLEYYPGSYAADVFDPVGDSFEVVHKS